MSNRTFSILVSCLCAVWMFGAMSAMVLVGASALGMWEAVLVAELVALGLILSGWVLLRRRLARPQVRFIVARHRERRGF